MPNPFDGYKNTAFDIVKDTMGYDATWTPSDGSGIRETRVLFKEPTAKQLLMFDVDYDPNDTWIEYRKGDGFDTLLFDLVRANTDTETVIIEGVSYYVREVFRIWDGDNFFASLEKVV